MRFRRKGGAGARWLATVLASLGAWGGRADGQALLILTDVRGQIWDLGPLGEVVEGSNDTFDGGFSLFLDGSPIEDNPQSGRPPHRVEKTELIVGPVKLLEGLWLTRRVGLAGDRRSLRFLTLVENRSGQHRQVEIGHRSIVGGFIQRVITSSGGEVLGEMDHAVAFQQGRPRNSVIEIFGLPGKKRTLEVNVIARPGQDDVLVGYSSIAVPPRRTIALATFAIQTRAGSELEAMREFDPEAALRDLPPRIRAMIVNLGRRIEVPALEVEREVGCDLLVLSSGTVLRGEMRVERYALRGPYGAIEIPAAEVVAIERPERGELARVGCRDGQIFAGRLEPDPIPFALQGEALSVPVGKIRSLGIRAEPPAAPKDGDDAAEDAPPIPPGSWIALSSGDLWRLESFSESPVAITLHGDIPLDLERVVRIVFRGGDGPYHLLRLRSGSRLAGIVRKGTLRVALAGGRSMEIPVGRILWAGLPEDPEGDIVGPGVFVAELDGDERIVGKVIADRLMLRTELGELAVPISKIREIDLDRKANPPEADILLWTGSRIRGRLAEEEIAMEADGIRLSVDLARIETMAQPRPGIPEDARARLRDLLDRLDAPEFDAREEAQRALVAWIKDPAAGIGGALAVELASLLEGKDLSEEQAARIRSILETVEGGSKGGGAPEPEEEPGILIP